MQLSFEDRFCYLYFTGNSLGVIDFLKHNKLVIVSTLIFSLLSFPCYSWGNGGPVRPDNIPTATLWPVSETPIEIEAENLQLDLVSGDGRMHVMSTYLLVNPSDNDESVRVAFPILDLPSQLPVIVRWQGDPLPVESYPLEADTNAQKVLRVPTKPWLDDRIAWLDPINGKVYKTEIPVQTTPPGYVAAFSLVVPSHGKGRLEVEYWQEGNQDTGRFVNPTWHYTYLLQPASFWAGFGELKITVIIPPGWRLATIPPLRQQEFGPQGLIYSGDFSGLPAGDLHLSAVSTRGFWLGLGRPWQIWVLLILAAMAVGGIWRYSELKTPELTYNLIHLVLLVIILWLTGKSFRLPLLSYPFTVFQYPLIVGLVSLTALGTEKLVRFITANRAT